MAEDDLKGATDELIRDFGALTDEDLHRRIWLAAAVIAARGGVLTPELVLLPVATQETPENWPELRDEVRAQTAPNYLRDP